MTNGIKRCFVLMGFGQKVDYRTKRTLDLDKTYRIIRAAIEEAGLECIRADDIVHSGVIDKPMYENLAPEPWMKATAESQLKKLVELLKAGAPAEPSAGV